VTRFELEVRGHEANGITVVGLTGELDLTNAADVEQALVRAAGVGGLVLDLNGVTFVDSAALHMLFRVASGIGDARRFGVVLEPTALVARTLDIVGFDAVATVRPTLDELVGEPTN
jgi:anti-sigma B factor antagonist